MREHIHTKQKGKRCVIFSALGLRKVPLGLKEKEKKRRGSEAPLHWIEVEAQSKGVIRVFPGCNATSCRHPGGRTPLNLVLGAPFPASKAQRDTAGRRTGQVAPPSRDAAVNEPSFLVLALSPVFGALLRRRKMGPKLR